MATLLYWDHAFDVNLWVSGLHSYSSVSALDSGRSLI